ncbi:MAG: hypothetical protein Q3976_10070 [Corynebacterium sp.]|nr:hypothetical protein [Corynebacterium sp.]
MFHSWKKISAVRVLSALALSIGVFASSTTSAAALTQDNVSLYTETSKVTAGTTLTGGMKVRVQTTAVKRNTEYLVGICEVTTANLPACAVVATVETKNRAVLNTIVTLPQAPLKNAHAGIPGQPAHLDLKNPVEIVITEAAGNAGHTTPVGDSISFKFK